MWLKHPLSKMTFNSRHCEAIVACAKCGWWHNMARHHLGGDTIWPENDIISDRVLGSCCLKQQAELHVLEGSSCSPLHPMGSNYAVIQFCKLGHCISKWWWCDDIMTSLCHPKHLDYWASINQVNVLNWRKWPQINLWCCQPTNPNLAKRAVGEPELAGEVTKEEKKSWDQFNRKEKQDKEFGMLGESHDFQSLQRIFLSQEQFSFSLQHLLPF